MSASYYNIYTRVRKDESSVTVYEQVSTSILTEKKEGKGETQTVPTAVLRTNEKIHVRSVEKWRYSVVGACLSKKRGSEIKAALYKRASAEQHLLYQSILYINTQTTASIVRCRYFLFLSGYTTPWFLYNFVTVY